MAIEDLQRLLAEDVQNAEAQTKSLLEAEMSPTDVTRVEKRAEAHAVGTIPLAVKAFKADNAAQDAYMWADRAMIPNDPNFRIEDNTDLYEGIPDTYWEGFSGVKSKEEGLALRDDVLTTMKDRDILQNAGVRGVAVSMLANIIDADLPLTFIGGGQAKVASTLAKAGMAGRGAKMLSMAAGGLEAGVVTSGVSVMTGPTGTWRDIPSAGLSGLAFGGALGIFGKTKAQIDAANLQAAKLREDFVTKAPAAGTRDYSAPVSTPTPTVKPVRDTQVSASAIVSQAEANLTDLNKSIQALDEALNKAQATGDDSKFDSLYKTREELKSAAASEQAIIDANKEVSNSVHLFGDSTVGAAQTGASGPLNWTDLTDPKDIAAHADVILDHYDAKNVYGSAYTDEPLNQLAKNLDKAAEASPVVTDFARLWNSDSNVAKAVAVSLAEDAAGRIRNNTSGAMLTDLYTSEIAADVLLNIDTVYTKWSGAAAKEGLLGDLQVALADPSKRLAFYKEVLWELETRKQTGKPGSTNEFVLQLADHIDSASAKGARILKGADGEIPVKGAEDLKPKSGYFRREWSGASLTRLIKAGVQESAIIRALTEAYRKMHPTWEPDWPGKMAESVVRRMQKQLSGIDVNLMRMLRENGEVYMRQFLESSGLSPDAVSRMIHGLRQSSPDNTKVGVLRHRVELDMRTPIQGTDFHLLDLTNMDIVDVWSRYSRRTAGSAAMARHGIQYEGTRMLKDVMQQQDPSLTSEFLDGFFDYFHGAPVAGGVNPWVMRPIRATNLSLLGGIALSQAAETSVSFGAFGVRAYMHTLADVAKAHWNGDLTATVKQLEPWLKIVHGEEHLMRPDLAIAEMQVSAGQFAEQGAWLDRMLSKGARIQSILSGFNTVRRLQTNAVIHSMVGKLDTAFSKLAKLDTTAKTVEEFEAAASKVMNPKRLYDIGIDTVLRDRLLKYWRNGTVKRVSKNEVDLNLKAWDADDVRELAAVLNRTAGLYVQRGFIGEGTVWFNKTEGAVLTNLKKFTLLAMQKQGTRNLRMQDPEALAALTWGLATASTVVMARNALNGRDNDDPVEITKQAVMLNNLTGWVPMWSDPITAMLGMDDLQFSKNYRQGLGGDVVGTPPVFTQLGKIAHAPEAAASLVMGNGTKDDVHAVQATPVVGRLPYLGWLYHSMLQDIEEEKVAEKAASKAKEAE